VYQRAHITTIFLPWNFTGVQCHCPVCEERKNVEAEEAEAKQAKKDKKAEETARAKAEGLAKPRMLARLKAWIGIGGRADLTHAPEGHLK
jgi:hypothetical protein